MVMLVPAQGALQPVGGRLSITVITSSWLQVHGALSWDSFQRPGNGGPGASILGSPRHPSCHAVCSTVHWAETWVLPSERRTCFPRRAQSPVAPMPRG